MDHQTFYALFTLSMIQASIIHNKISVHKNKKTRTISDFVKQLGTAMSADFMLVPVERQVAKPQTLIRLDRKHFHRLGSLPPTPKKLRPRRDCKVCYDKMASSGEKKRCRETGFWCVVCEVPLCFEPCFEKFHMQANYIMD